MNLNPTRMNSHAYRSRILFLLSLSFITACRDKHQTDTSPTAKPRRYYVNERFRLRLREAAEIIDTGQKLVNPQTGQSEYPIYSIRFDQVVKDDRQFGKTCQASIYGFVYVKLSLSKWGQRLADTFFYSQCTRLDNPTSPPYTRLMMDGNYLYLFRVHPLPDSVTKNRANDPYSVELILKR